MGRRRPLIAPEFTGKLKDVDLALRDAAFRGDVKKILWCVDNRADANRPEAITERTSMHYSAQQGQVDAVRTLACEGGGRVQEKDYKGRTPLHYAARRGHIDVIHVLVSVGAKVESKDEHGGTPLHHACEKGQGAAVKCLLHYKANPNAERLNGMAVRTPLHTAAAAGHDTVVANLLKGGADHRMRGEYGHMAIHFAAIMNHPKCLLALTTDPNVVVDARDSPQSSAHTSTHPIPRSQRHLMGPSGEARRGCTALHLAAEVGSEECVKVLVRAGAALSAKDRQGRLPRDLALANRHLELAQTMASLSTASLLGPDLKSLTLLEKEDRSSASKGAQNNKGAPPPNPLSSPSPSPSDTPVHSPSPYPSPPFHVTPALTDVSPETRKGDQSPSPPGHLRHMPSPLPGPPPPHHRNLSPHVSPNPHPQASDLHHFTTSPPSENGEAANNTSHVQVDKEQSQAAEKVQTQAPSRSRQGVPNIDKPPPPAPQRANGAQAQQQPSRDSAQVPSSLSHDAGRASENTPKARMGSPSLFAAPRVNTPRGRDGTLSPTPPLTPSSESFAAGPPDQLSFIDSVTTTRRQDGIGLEIATRPTELKRSDSSVRRLRECVRNITLFETLGSERVASEVYSSMKEFFYPQGSTVFNQGEDCDGFYVIENGELDVLMVGEDGRKVMNTLIAGDTFGELAIVLECPRTATVRTATDCTVWRMDSGTFRRHLMVPMISRRRAYASFLANVPILRPLTSYDRLAISDRLRVGDFKQGEYVINAGNMGSTFYLLEEGRAEALINGVIVHRYSPGDIFGELALFKKNPRAADVVAATNVRVVQLDKRAFDQLMANETCYDFVCQKARTYEDVKMAMGLDSKCVV